MALFSTKNHPPTHPPPTHPQDIFFADFYITLEAEIWHATLVHKNKMIQDVWDICPGNIFPGDICQNSFVHKYFCNTWRNLIYPALLKIWQVQIARWEGASIFWGPPKSFWDPKFFGTKNFFRHTSLCKILWTNFFEN